MHPTTRKGGGGEGLEEVSHSRRNYRRVASNTTKQKRERQRVRPHAGLDGRRSRQSLGGGNTQTRPSDVRRRLTLSQQPGSPLAPQGQGVRGKVGCASYSSSSRTTSRRSSSTSAWAFGRHRPHVHDQGVISCHTNVVPALKGELRVVTL